MNTLVARVFMAFLAQDRRKPKTFQAPHYQRDPPGVQVFMGGTIRETPKALPDDHHGNPAPNPLCFPCCLCSNSLRGLLLKIVRPLGRGRLERRRRSYQMTITETQSPIPLFPLLPSVQILFAAFC